MKINMVKQSIKETKNQKPKNTKNCIKWLGVHTKMSWVEIRAWRWDHA